MEVSMRTCIYEQATTMQRVIEHAPAEVEKALGKLDRSFDRIFLVGSGTSFNAALAAKYMLEFFNDAEVQVIAPFDYIHYFPRKRITENTLVIGISQTARSTGTIAAVKIARQCGAGTIFVTAFPQAEGAQCAEAVLDTWTGSEPVGPKTKGFTSTMASLFFLAAGLAKKPVDLAEKILTMPEFISRTLDISEKVMPGCVEEFSAATSIKVIGYGPGMATVREGGLKVLETMRVPVEVYDVEEYMHGPYHCLESDTFIIFIAPAGQGLERMLRLVQFAQSITNHTLVITGEDCPAQEIKNLVIALPGGIDEKLAPLGYIIPVQLLANDITLAKGRKPEQSRYPNFHAILGSKTLPK